MSPNTRGNTLSHNIFDFVSILHSPAPRRLRLPLRVSRVLLFIVFSFKCAKRLMRSFNVAVCLIQTAVDSSLGTVQWSTLIKVFLFIAISLSHLDQTSPIIAHIITDHNRS